MPQRSKRKPAIYSDPAKRCGWYGPGHEVHWIQAKKSWEEPGLVEEGEITHIESGLIRVRIGSEDREYWNHDTECLRRTVRRRGRRVVVQERWSLLKVPSTRGYSCFCIAKSGSPRVECNGH
ncbi:MAG: hypothetical protein WDA27_07770 [Actinomycetota bacterium]